MHGMRVVILFLIFNNYFLGTCMFIMKHYKLLLLSISFIPSTYLHAMKSMHEVHELLRKSPTWAKALVAGSGLYLAAKTHDELLEKKQQFVDMSTPSALQPLSCYVETIDENELSQSVTKRQFEADWYFKYSLFANIKALFSQKYEDQVDGVLYSHFWLFMPTARNRMSALIMQLSKNEHEARQNGYVTLVHGTSHGGSILLRTIFDEILRQQKPHEQFLLLRNKGDIAELSAYSDVHAYYDANINKAPRTPEMQRIPGCGPAPTGNYITHFDKGPAQKHILAANLGFFGSSSWSRDGYKESSAEFVTRPSSWTYQAIDIAIAGFQNPFIIFDLAYDLYKNPRALMQFQALLDKNFKGFSNRKLMESVFQEYNCAELYKKYSSELNQIENDLSTGLLQLFIKERQAKKWCYLAGQLGIRRESSPDALIELENNPLREEMHQITLLALPQQQARVLLHEELKEHANMKMRFYVLGKPQKHENHIKRLYEIAEEIKAYKEQKHS